MKININMKGLDKNSLGSEKTYQQPDQMLYGHMMPGMDPMGLQYNPNLAIQHLQNQLNLLTLQQ